MADNQINIKEQTGSNLRPVKTRTHSGVDWAASLIAYGAAGSETFVTTDNRFPVELSASTIAALTPPAAIVGFATAANQATGNTSLATLAGAVSGAEMQVDVLTMPTVAVTGTFWQATQPVSGTVAVTGTFWQATQPVSLASLPTLPAGTNLIGKIANSPDSSTIYSGTTALTPKFAAISASSSGNTAVVASVASKKIRVLSYRFQADADVSVKFRDNTAGVDLTGAMASGAKGGGGGAAFSPVGHFETASGNALSINLSSAVQVSGHLCYVEV